MQVDIVTLFPDVFVPVFGSSIIKRAQESGCVTVTIHDLRAYTHDKRRTVDDRPFGGGPGMVMKPEPIFEAVEAIELLRHADAPSSSACQVVLMSPQGVRLTQAKAQELSSFSHLLIICGHYEGVDERVRALIDQEISIGDYVLTGGEIPAMALVDAVVRLLPGALGHAEATNEESFQDGLLEYPHYTRPVRFRGMSVPGVLRSGNHEEIGAWRRAQAIKRTAHVRPDLLR